MAVKDGLGPRPVAQTAKRYFLNRLETRFKPRLCLPTFLHCQLPPCSCPPGAGFRSAQLRSKLESKDRVAGLKHHSIEGRIGPAACSPDCQTLLSEPNLDFTCVSALPTATLLVSSWSWLSFCTAPAQAGVQGPCRRAKTPWQWRTDWARGL